MFAPLLALTLLAAPAAKPATNTKDPVCNMTVDAKAMTAEVRGQAYRVCSKHCVEALQKDPDKYLNKDGSLKNAPKAK